ncbi:unnamed protein product [Candidula unifasciata]|uniref:Tubulin polymerization-promoting protein family member 3 n=1 Tax=Candidula unifasciata TaxID=100452 RepID=A0A8S3ZTH3_9EUPU|nr:unnamed protein product [Candidula unifasciata]
MAFSGLDIMGKVKETLGAYKGSSETGDSMKLTPLLKCMDACGMSQYKTIIEARIWPKLQDANKKISIDKCSTVLIDEIAACVIGDKNKVKGKVPLDNPEVQALATDIKMKIAAKAGQAMLKSAAVDATTARLTDVSKYTGTHGKRFDESGKGKGLEGRADLVDASGYVGNYKGVGTFGKK